MKIGDIVKLRTSLLGNEIGTLGIVYEEYNLGWGDNISIIFENGNYDGFSPEEQEKFIEYVGHSQLLETYKFTNVINLSWDFNSGIFDEIFKQKKI